MFPPQPQQQQQQQQQPKEGKTYAAPREYFIAVENHLEQMKQGLDPADPANMELLKEINLLSEQTTQYLDQTQMLGGATRKDEEDENRDPYSFRNYMEDNRPLREQEVKDKLEEDLKDVDHSPYSFDTYMEKERHLREDAQKEIDSIRAEGQPYGKEIKESEEATNRAFTSPEDRAEQLNEKYAKEIKESEEEVTRGFGRAPPEEGLVIGERDYEIKTMITAKESEAEGAMQDMKDYQEKEFPDVTFHTTMETTQGALTEGGLGNHEITTMFTTDPDTARSVESGTHNFAEHSDVGMHITMKDTTPGQDRDSMKEPLGSKGEGGGGGKSGDSGTGDGERCIFNEHGGGGCGPVGGSTVEPETVYLTQEDFNHLTGGGIIDVELLGGARGRSWREMVEEDKKRDPDAYTRTGMNYRGSEEGKKFAEERAYRNKLEAAEYHKQGKEKSVEDIEKLMGRKYEKIEEPKLSKSDLDKIGEMQSRIRDERALREKAPEVMKRLQEEKEIYRKNQEEKEVGVYKNKFGDDFTIKKSGKDEYEVTSKGITYKFSKDELDKRELAALEKEEAKGGGKGGGGGETGHRCIFNEYGGGGCG